MWLNFLQKKLLFKNCEEFFLCENSAPPNNHCSTPLLAGLKSFFLLEAIDQKSTTSFVVSMKMNCKGGL
jgi:hypothetical protein